jgi:hypothetical protein
MRGAIPPLNQSSFMAWCLVKSTGTTLPFTLLQLHFIPSSGKAQLYNAELRAGLLGVRVPAGAGNFSLHHRVQNGSGAPPATCPMGIRDSFPGVKAAGG